MKTEKVAINVGVMELSQIDLLVDSMQYNNRSDFVRIAIRELLKSHKDDLNRYYAQSQELNFKTDSALYGGIGIYRLSKNELDNAKHKRKKINVMVMGILFIDDVPDELFIETIESIKIYGKIQTTKRIHGLIESERLIK